METVKKETKLQKEVAAPQTTSTVTKTKASEGSGAKTFQPNKQKVPMIHCNQQ